MSDLIPPRAPTSPDRHGIVIGSSLAGLLAARVLSERFEQVTLLEQDHLPAGPEPRKGVPQGQHAHGLLRKGAEILSELFPGLFQEIEAEGGLAVDMGESLAWFHFGRWKQRPRSNIILQLQSRPFLEWKVRERVKALPNVRILDGRHVVGLLAGEGGRIQGVRVERPGHLGEETMAGALVVDASGRGSRTPHWLEEFGYPKVEESTVTVDVGYASRVYQSSGALPADWKLLFVYPRPPEERRMGVVFPIEGNRWMVTLGGWMGDHPPADEAGFLEFARSLPRPEVYQFLQGAEPLGQHVVLHKFPSNLRRHYERMPRFPEGLVVLGDGVCSFNPIYGQGMTSCGLQALVLRECLGEQLRASLSGDLTGLAQRYRKRVPGVIDTPWMLATGEDLRYPQAEGRRPPGNDLLSWYVARVHRAAGRDPQVMVAFLKVMNLLQPPTALFAPGTLYRVLASGGDVGNAGAGAASPG